MGELCSIGPMCGLAEAWFRRHWDDRDSQAKVDGKPVALDDAVDRAVQILDESQYPLVYGLSRGATCGQRAAVALAEARRRRTGYHRFALSRAIDHGDPRGGRGHVHVG